MNDDFLDNSNKLIEDILKRTAGEIPDDGWEAFRCKLEYTDRDAVQAQAVYVKDGDEHQFPVGIEVMDLALELEKLYFSKDKGRLQRAEFIYDLSTENFDVDFQYEDED